jgi:hypothetical protein
LFLIIGVIIATMGGGAVTEVHSRGEAGGPPPEDYSR